MKFFCKYIKVFISIFFILVVTFSLATIAVHYISKTAITNNVKTSIELLNKEGEYKDIYDFWAFRLDNYTDALMLNIAMNADCTKPVSAAMLNYRSYMPNKSPIACTRDLIDGEETTDNVVPYGRYWHGYQTILRPVLTILDYKGIRIANYIILSILVVFCTYLIYTRISSAIAALFFISLMLINFPMIPLSMQFSTCFYLAFIGIIVILYNNKLLEHPTRIYSTFFIIGGCTSFFDLLTTPQLTLGLPLIFYMLRSNDNRWKSIIYISIVWAIGYTSIWTTKWLLAYVLTDYNIFEDVIHAAKIRSSNTFLGERISIIDHVLTPPVLMMLGTIISTSCIICYNLFHYKKNVITQRYSYLLIIALIVPIWYFLMQNHSMEHIWFTWRAELVSILSLLIYLYKTINLKRNIYKQENG